MTDIQELQQKLDNLKAAQDWEGLRGMQSEFDVKTSNDAVSAEFVEDYIRQTLTDYADGKLSVKNHDLEKSFKSLVLYGIPSDYGVSEQFPYSNDSKYHHLAFKKENDGEIRANALKTIEKQQMHVLNSYAQKSFEKMSFEEHNDLLKTLDQYKEPRLEKDNQQMQDYQKIIDQMALDFNSGKLQIEDKDLGRFYNIVKNTSYDKYQSPEDQKTFDDVQSLRAANAKLARDDAKRKGNEKQIKKLEVKIKGKSARDIAKAELTKRMQELVKNNFKGMELKDIASFGDVPNVEYTPLIGSNKNMHSIIAPYVAQYEAEQLSHPQPEENSLFEEPQITTEETVTPTEPAVPIAEEEKADTVLPPADADGTAESPENDRHDEMDLPEEVQLYLKKNNITLDEYKQNKEEIDAKIKKVQEAEKEPIVEQQDKDDERKATENQETPEWAKEEALLYDNITTQTEPDGTKTRLYNVESINYDNGDYARKFCRDEDGKQGFILNLSKENPSHVSICGLGDDGIPSIEDFKVMARAEKEKAQRNGDTPNINLGKIRDPEFKARLMIAMMEEGVKINNAPKLEELKNAQDNSIAMSAETEKRLQKLVAPEKEKEKEGNEEQKPLVISQDRIDGEKISRLRGLAIASKAIKMDDKQYEALKEENKHMFSQEQIELMDKIRLKEDSQDYKNLSEEDKKKVEEAKKGINDLANNTERNKILEARGILRAARKAGSDKSQAPKQEEIDKARNNIKARQMAFKVTERS